MQFPGNNAHVDIPVTLASLGITDQFTVSIQFLTDPVAGERFLAEDGTGAASNAFYLGVKPSEDLVFARLNTNQARRFNDSIPTAALAGIWTTLSMTYDGTTMRVYREGAQIYEVAITGQVGSGDRNLHVGDRNNQFVFQGLVGSLQIWNVALTPEELAETADRDLLGTEPGLVGYWPFHEGGGTIVHDLTAGANHGAIVGNLLWE